MSLGRRRMVTMTTRSQPRRRKVRQELVGTVPRAQLVSSSTTHWQVEASSAFPGGLAAGHDPSAGTAVGKGVCRLQVSFWWEQGPSRGRAGACPPVCSMVVQNSPSLWVVSAVVANVGSDWPEPGQAEKGRGRTSAVTIATGKF